MALIKCPECNSQISDKAEKCPHCGLPSGFFMLKTPETENFIAEEIQSDINIDYSNIGNVMISFDRDYCNCFSKEHYISGKEVEGLKSVYGTYYECLNNELIYNYILNHSSKLRFDMSMAKIFLRKFSTLDADVSAHNNEYIETIVERERDYFDNILITIDPNIKLDDEQRRAVITDDDYCLLVAGAGAGKTTTMAAKVKYLVEKKGVLPEEIIVISYTNKAIGELKDRINNSLKIPAKICTFHSFAFEIVKQFTAEPPEVNFSSYQIVFDMLEKAVFNNKPLMRNLVLFMGYYFDLTEDVFKFDSLEQYHIIKEGFALKPRNYDEVYKKIVETGKDKYIIKLICFMMNFIEQYKTTGYNEGGFEILRKKTDNPRTLLFLDIAEQVYLHYQETLKQRNQIDFSDMINDAHFYLQELERQHLELPYKYIIIDEFQDIARQRFNLTKRLSQITKAKVVAVGDDWQSIYAFAGSDISLFTRFIDLMGSGTELKITHTYRNSQELIDIAGGFIQKNSEQIRKKLISPKHLENPVVITPFDDSIKPMGALSNVVVEIIGKLLSDYGEKSSILLLGRYNYDMYKLFNTGHFEQQPGIRVKCKKYPGANISFLTAHSAKGLGYDNVVLINMFEGKFGFPCQIEFPLKYEFNKNYGLPLYICTNDAEVCDFMTNDKVNRYDIFKCAKCTDGYMIVRKSAKNGQVFYGCTNYYNDDRKCNNMISIRTV